MGSPKFASARSSRTTDGSARSTRSSSAQASTSPTFRSRDGYTRDGRTVADAWRDGMQAHRGTAVAGFPNLFFLLGPNTALGHTSVVVMAEARAGYVLQALRHMRSHGLGAVEVRREAQEAWNARLQRKMRGTVWTAGGCASWYLDENGRNTTLWPGFTFRFRRLLSGFDAPSYAVQPLVAAPQEEPVQELALVA